MNQYHLNTIKKIVIVSDIKGKSDSIIPYGLRLAKHLHAEVDIIHVVDSRSQHGVHSRYADSQSITPGNKMSYEEILQREINISNKAIKKVLSREASVLNYPLKINTIVEENSILNCLNSLTENVLDVLVLLSSEPDNYIFHSKKEIIETFKKSNLPSLIVPPGAEYYEFNKVLLATTFGSSNGFEKHMRAYSFLSKFHPLINAVDVAKPHKHLEKEIMSKAWLQVAENIAFLSPIKTNVLTGNSYLETLLSYLKKTEPDMVIFNKKTQGLFSNWDDNKLAKKLIENANCPVLY